MKSKTVNQKHRKYFMEYAFCQKEKEKEKKIYTVILLANLTFLCLDNHLI